jgi:ElaB/YqjD/DUF883 family membrane-anchored ribosome-binding protein
MSKQSFGREPGGEKNKQKVAGEDSSAARMARDVADKTQASTITNQVKGLLDDQVGNGADMVGHLANSAKRAADDLERNAPQLAVLVRSAADRLESYADGLHDQSVDQLVRAASNYTRRQPAVVFGLAALVGFFALRTFKSTPSAPTPSSKQPSQLSPAGGLYGH